ncbi:hypothetical protein [Dongshaea marina]|uniref:hypothetical protein n=1 Tax=Dongshaea marina TaxID=2047966 RepID=UPI000D3E3460|nr:hypothetical protein [Dongshaea marina]
MDISIEANQNIDLINRVFGEMASQSTQVGSILVNETLISTLVTDDACFLVCSIDTIDISEKDVLLHCLDINSTLAFESRGSICFDSESKTLHYVSKIDMDSPQMHGNDFESKVNLFKETHSWICDVIALGQVKLSI